MRTKKVHPVRDLSAGRQGRLSKGRRKEIISNGIYYSVNEDNQVLTRTVGAKQPSVVRGEFRIALNNNLVYVLDKPGLDERRYRDRKSTRLNSSHTDISRMPSSA